MDKRSARLITTGVLVVLVAAGLAIAFLRPTSEIVVQGPTPDFSQATAGTAVVTSITAEGGFRLFGMTFTSPTHRVQVSFIAPPACTDVVATAPRWPTGDAACGPDGGLSGDISGTGRTADGSAIVSVRFEVSKDCYATLSLGDVWSATPADC